MTHPTPWRVVRIDEYARPVWVILDAEGSRIALCDSAAAADVMIVTSKYTTTFDKLREEARLLRLASRRKPARVLEGAAKS